MSNNIRKRLWTIVTEALSLLAVLLVIYFVMDQYGAFDIKEIPNDETLYVPQMTNEPTESPKNDSEEYHSEETLPISKETLEEELPAFETQIDYSSKLPFYTSQLEYAAEHELILERAMQEEADLGKWLSQFEGEPYYLDQINKLGDVQFKRTIKPGEYIYFGELKDNRPDGYGILIQRSEIEYGAIKLEERYYNFLYIGQFTEGRYNGFGMQFCTPATGIYSLYDLCPFEKGSVEFTRYYCMWYNYVTYFGYFSRGEQTGQGNYFYASTVDSSEGKIDIDNIRYFHVQSGAFKNGLLNGYGREYWNGLLQYEGGLKEGYKHGYGKEYNYLTDILAYEGEFKDDKRHGRGTSYTDKGEIDYSGEWRYGDYA